MTDEDRTPGSDAEPPGDDATLSSSDIDEPTVGVGDGSPTTKTPIPESIGEYKVLGVLGEGGMGIVYEAEQASPRRRVALKVIRGGQFVEESHVRMFQREAETLARLKHPNIGAIYESGRTEDGHHFFAMELVRGKTLDRYLAERADPASDGELDRRLALFRKLCDAVQYAHQRGVIHRDLKPSNIIVTDDDTVKILDFGLARITEEDIAATQVTEVGVIKGTLPYMSPEQAKGDVEAIDIRTDVYALGVILYEMLAGRRPYDTARAALLEAVRVICEEPPTPLSSTWRGSRKLDPDVETIVGTALEKEPDRRYPSASALSDDVGRFLDSQPILARPPSAVYQLRKMVSRHRAAFAASLAMVVVLVVASVVSTSLFFKAKRDSERARVEALKSDQVAEFLTGMLEGVGPSVALGRDTVMLREILDKTAQRIGSELADQPEVESTVRTILGGTYRDLGEFEAAEVQHREAVAQGRKLLGDDHPQTLIAIGHLGLTLQRRGAYEEAEELFLEAIEGMRRRFGNDHFDTRTNVSNYGQLLAETGRFAEAEPYHRETLELFRRNEGPEDSSTMIALANLGILLRSMDRASESEELLREALETKRRVLGNEHPETLNGLEALAVTLEHQGKLDEAEPLHAETVASSRRIMGERHPATLRALSNYGVFLTKVGRTDEGERLLRESLESRRQVMGDDHLETLISINTMGFWYYRQNRFDESEALVREAVERGRRVLGSEHPDFLVWLFNLGKLLQLRDRPAEAEPLYRETLETRRKVLGPAHADTLLTTSELAVVVNGLGRPQEAEQLLREGLQAARRDNGDADASTQKMRSQLAGFYRSHDRLDEVRTVVTERLAAMRSAAESSEDPALKNAFAWEALTCEPADLQDPEAALGFALAAVELGDWADPDAMDTLALAYHRTGDNAKAVEVGTKALALIDENDTGRREPFEAALARYRSELD